VRGTADDGLSKAMRMSVLKWVALGFVVLPGASAAPGLRVHSRDQAQTRAAGQVFAD
jgi:hypothetical protein